jgi:hypothetical protein
MAEPVSLSAISKLVKVAVDGFSAFSGKGGPPLSEEVRAATNDLAGLVTFLLREIGPKSSVPDVTSSISVLSTLHTLYNTLRSLQTRLERVQQAYQVQQAYHAITDQPQPGWPLTKDENEKLLSRIEGFRQLMIPIADMAAGLGSRPDELRYLY